MPRIQSSHRLYRYFLHVRIPLYMFFFFFNDTATTEIYTLSLHDALPISNTFGGVATLTDTETPNPIPCDGPTPQVPFWRSEEHTSELSHTVISYAVFCLKKKKKTRNSYTTPQNTIPTRDP